MIKEIDLGGMFISPMLGYLAVAAILYFPLHLLMRRCGFYRWVWHPPLFDLSIFVIILAGLVVWTM